MEDAGIHPLLPVHKHDPRMILPWQRFRGLWLQVCSSVSEPQSTCTLSTCTVAGCVDLYVCVSACVCVTKCFYVFESRPESLCLLLRLHKVCVWSGIELFLVLSFVKSNQIRAALRFGCQSRHGKRVSVSVLFGYVLRSLVWCFLFYIYIYFRALTKQPISNTNPFGIFHPVQQDGFVLRAG